jgi:hypothetical protein
MVVPISKMRGKSGKIKGDKKSLMALVSSGPKQLIGRGEYSVERT